MGDEYEYLIGSVAEDAGTPSVFRAACQFGGGDAAATLAALAYNVMFGEAGVDYGKSNPNSIGLFYPIDGALNGVDEAHEFGLMDDGTCRFLLPGNPMITDVYAGTYTIDEDGVTVHIAGLANIDPASPYKTPGLWSYIDGATGDATIVIDTQAHTFTAK